MWIDTPANRPSVFANSLFALNKAPAGTFVGRAARFIKATMLGSDGPGLVLLPPVTGGPAQAIGLSNSIVENNNGGNCPADPASIIDDGANLQFPDTTWADASLRKGLVESGLISPERAAALQHERNALEWKTPFGKPN